MKVQLPSVTLFCADTTSKSHLAERAIKLCQSQCDFGATVFLGPGTVPIKSIEDYSRFCIRNMHKHIKTSHALVVQSDGYILNPKAWTDEYLKYDFIGAPWLPSNCVGNGGFSLRSKKLMELTSKLPDGGDHPEDASICLHHRQHLEGLGIKFSPLELARKFAFEGRSWDSRNWTGTQRAWSGEFGYHSWLTPLPNLTPRVYHHSGERGDVIYALATMRALGGGVLFLSADNRYPFPGPCRETVDTEWVDGIAPLLESQDYVWKASFTHGLPHSISFDLNKFRAPWKDRTSKDFESIFALHQQAFKTLWPSDQPWLEIPDPVEIPGKPIVVARSPRYQNDHFPWFDLCQKYHDRMVFVGSEQEASVFSGFSPSNPVKWNPTPTALDLARVISGAKVFIGNQSFPLSIAHGLCKPVIVETWPKNQNCNLKRPNAIYFDGKSVDIPESWLK